LDLLAAIGDLRAIRAGSFFLGQMKFIPERVRMCHCS
jgi:hypothetical protein